jgi:hypothetical protein
VGRAPASAWRKTWCLREDAAALRESSNSLKWALFRQTMRYLIGFMMDV